MGYWDADDAIGVHPRLATLVAKNLLCNAFSLFVRREKLRVGVAGNAVLIEIFDDVFELSHSFPHDFGLLALVRGDSR